MRIVAELNYTASAVARSLKVRETYAIGLFVTATLLMHPFRKR